ncbi:queuosine precursor transporter [Pontibacter sp. G13]|uniref:queuosine precursor transporter n=1 Tax=Pontibacter sp. G13 TaxID=3074898 RepID=UPI00288A67A0|nr:queuosine precursor transporter [Pontibacter sp. G13]WNJ21179.1 queuosine precursor transporter [Pontibacter sp. G13]
MLLKRENLLFIILGGFFVTNALIAEFIGGKIFSLEATLGMEPVNWTLFGQSGLSFNLTAGVLLWPVVFIMTDIINEYFGRRGVRLLTFLASGLIAYAFLMVYMAMEVSPAAFWLDLHQDIDPNIDVAFGRVFGQGLRIIIGSLTAFLIGQLVDVMVFQRIRKITGEKMLWLRATGSTLVSQLVDSYVVLFLAFYLLPPPEQRMEFGLVIALGVVSYCYKFLMALVLTPLLYVVHWGIDLFLGKELAAKLIERAAAEEPPLEKV